MRATLGELSAGAGGASGRLTFDTATYDDRRAPGQAAQTRPVCPARQSIVVRNRPHFMCHSVSHPPPPPPPHDLGRNQRQPACNSVGPIPRAAGGHPLQGTRLQKGVGPRDDANGYAETKCTVRVRRGTGGGGGQGCVRTGGGRGEGESEGGGEGGLAGTPPLLSGSPDGPRQRRAQKLLKLQSSWH